MAEGFTKNIASSEISSNSSSETDEPALFTDRIENWVDFEIEKILEEVNMIIHDQTVAIRLDIRKTIERIQNEIYAYIHYKFLKRKKNGELPPIDSVVSEFQRVFNINIEDISPDNEHEYSDVPNAMVVEEPNTFVDPSTCETIFDLIDCISASGTVQLRISETDAEKLRLRYDHFRKRSEKLGNDLDGIEKHLRRSLDDVARKCKSSMQYFIRYLAIITEVKPKTIEDHEVLNRQFKSMNEFLVNFIKDWKYYEIPDQMEKFRETQDMMLNNWRGFRVFN